MKRTALIVSSNDDVGVPLWHALERAEVRAEIVPNDNGLWQTLHDRLTDTRSCWSVIVDAASHGRHGLDLIRKLRTGFPELFVLAALDSPDVAATQAVTAAGALEYLIHPYDEEQIKGCLRVWSGRPSLPPGRLVCFLPARGGDGASTVALHAAVAATRERTARGFGRRAMLADLDLQSGDLAFRVRLEPRFTLTDALQESGASGIVWNEWVCPWLGLDVLASPPSNASIPADAPRRMHQLLLAAKAAYPLIVADMPPAMYSASVAVSELADEVYLVCTPEAASLHIAGRRVEELQRAGVEIERVHLVLNRWGTHRSIGPEEVARAVGLPVSVTLGNDYAALNAAAVKGGVISPRSALGRQFEELGRRVAGIRAAKSAAA